jgi:ribosome biogenesis GTPase
MDSEPDIQPQQALVVATFSRTMDLRLADGNVVRARIKGKKTKPVCGDRVRCQPIPNEPEWLIERIEPRTNELTRPDSRGKVEVLAANINHICVVAAARPSPDWFIVDRYLCAAELMKVDAAVVFNKSELEFDAGKIGSVLSTYASLGYPTIKCSAKTGDNLDQLQDVLAGHTSIIAGQSGVGKSSIINYLLESANLRTGDISAATGEGRHTTVNSSMLTLPNGAEVIDSPGVRDYAPAVDAPRDVVLGFIDIREAGNDCKFANCRHDREPGCAVKDQVESGQISARRYESFRRMMVLTEQLATRRAY